MYSYGQGLLPGYKNQSDLNSGINYFDGKINHGHIQQSYCSNAADTNLQTYCPLNNPHNYGLFLFLIFS